MMKQECKWMKVLLRSFSYVLVAAVASAVTLLLWGQQPSKLTELEKIIDRQFVGQYDAAYVQDAAADAMVAALGDRWSFYMTEEEYDALMSDMRNSFVGIGVTVTPCEDGTGEEIISVIEGGPAHEVGLLTGDHDFVRQRFPSYYRLGQGEKVWFSLQALCSLLQISFY